MEQAVETMREQYKNSAVKLYDLCDYINKRAGILSALSYTFTHEELTMLKIIQDTKDDMKALAEDIENSRNAYADLDVDYEIYLTVCPKCNGAINIIDFATNPLGHKFNIYKCKACGEEIQDQYPNKQEHVLEHFKFYYEMLEKMIADKNIKEKDRLMFSSQYKQLKEGEQAIIKNNDNFTKKKEAQRKAINAAIASNEGMYKELLKFKHVFDRNIGEA